MDLLKNFLGFFIHLDSHISQIISSCGSWTYGVLFLIIFCETGLVVTPFLPGDSLLFVLGAFSARGDLSFFLLWISLVGAAFFGDMLNYWIGRKLAPRIVAKKLGFIKEAHLERTAAFFEKHGKKAIILARFLPLIRTFAPFLAGAGRMHYPVFALFNAIGAVLWVSVGLGSGHLFGNLPFVEKHFSMVVLAIIIISMLPAVIEYVRHKRGN
jgi:membrane-associated protein